MATLKINTIRERDAYKQIGTNEVVILYFNVCSFCKKVLVQIMIQNTKRACNQHALRKCFYITLHSNIYIRNPKRDNFIINLQTFI